MTKEDHNDAHDLVSFLTESKAVIDGLVKDQDGYVLKHIIKLKGLQEELKEAWCEAQKSIDTAIMELKEYNTIENVKRLDQAGLTGKQLKLKLHLFNIFNHNYKTKNTLNWLRRLLGIIDVIYGSLTKVFPLMEVVKEFKESLEQVIKIK